MAAAARRPAIPERGAGTARRPGVRDERGRHERPTTRFLPWARQGLANRIDAPDPAPRRRCRRELEVELALGVHGIDGADTTIAIAARDVQLYGPGDVIGIDPRAIVRTEPRDWITNFEPNYLAAIEFYDEDLPWRYTPAAPDAAGARLRPWIALVVLDRGRVRRGRRPRAGRCRSSR